MAPLLLSAVLTFGSAARHAALDGDAALMELSTRAALRGEQLLGPYSRFGFNHPGPLLFYLTAPLYAVMHGSPAALTLTVVVINLAAVIATILLLGRSSGNAAATWGAVVFAQFLYFLGPQASSFWNPQAALLPYLLSLVLLAAIAGGRFGLVPVAALTCSFVIQTHIGYALPLGACGAAALVLAARHARNARPAGNAVLGLVVLGVVWAPPLVEQATGRPGNLAALASFFLSRHGSHSWAETLRVGSRAASGPFLSLFDGAPAFGLDLTSGIVLGAQLLLLAWAWGSARRSGSPFQRALVVLSPIALAASILGLRGIVGPIEDYLVLPIAGSAALAWIAIGAVAADPLAKRSVGSRAIRLSIAALVGLILVRSVLLEGVVLVPHDASADTPAFAATRRFLTRRSERTCLVRHLDEAGWSAMTGLINELDRVGVQVLVDPEEAWRYPRRFRRERPPTEALVVASRQARQELVSLPNILVIDRTPDCVVGLARLGSALPQHLPMSALPAWAAEWDGISHRERFGDVSYRWIVGRQARISLSLPTGRPLRLTLVVMPFVATTQTQIVSLSFEGREVGKAELRSDRLWQAVTFQLPPTVHRPASVALDFLYARPRTDAFSSGFLRPLAGAVRELEIECDPGPCPGEEDRIATDRQSR